MSLNDHWVAMSETQPWKFFALQRLNFQSLKLNFQFLEGNFKMSEPCVGFKSITENIDTTTSGGKLVFHIFGALAEFERDIIKDGTNVGCPNRPISLDRFLDLSHWLETQ